MEAGCGKRHRASRAMVIKISGDWHHELVTNHHTSSRKYESSSADARTAICHPLSVMNIKQQNYEFNITKGKWFCRIMKRRRSIKTFFPYISFTICFVFPEDPASSFFFPDRTYPSSISSVKMLIKRLINHKCLCCEDTPCRVPLAVANRRKGRYCDVTLYPQKSLLITIWRLGGCDICYGFFLGSCRRCYWSQTGADLIRQDNSMCVKDAV